MPHISSKVNTQHKQTLRYFKKALKLRLKSGVLSRLANAKLITRHLPRVSCLISPAPLCCASCFQRLPSEPPADLLTDIPKPGLAASHKTQPAHNLKSRRYDDDLPRAKTEKESESRQSEQRKLCVCLGLPQHTHTPIMICKCA